jgi:hypothetical protein
MAIRFTPKPDPAPVAKKSIDVPRPATPEALDKAGLPAGEGSSKPRKTARAKTEKVGGLFGDAPSDGSPSQPDPNDKENG